MNKKILITGGAGFLGSNLVKKILIEKDFVTIVDNLSTGKYENIESYIDNEHFKFLNKDITDNNFTQYLKQEKFDQIYNFACPASPKYYLDYPIETWESSVLGIRNIVNAIRGTDTKMLQTSTSEVYGDCLVSPQTEEYWGNVNCNGLRACYDEGKRAAEALIYDNIRKYNTDIRVVRIFNTYGPNMNKNDGRVVSNFFYQAIKNEDMTIYGDGTQTRSFCYVDDTIDAIYRLMNLQSRVEHPVNVGNPVELSINEIAKKIKAITNSSSNIVYLDKMVDDPKKRRPDISKAKEILNWEPKVMLDEGLKNSYKFYLNNIVEK